MRMALPHDKNRLLHRFTVSYLLLLFIPIVMGGVVFAVASRLLWSNLLVNNDRLLSSACDQVEDAVTAADDFAENLMKNEELTNILSNAAQQNPYTIRHVANTLPVLRTANSVVDRYYFYYFGGDTEFVIGPQITFMHPQKYYASCFQWAGMASEDFWQMIRDQRAKYIYPAQDTTYFSASTRQLLITAPYRRTNFVRHNSGQIMVYLNEKRLLELFSPLRQAGAEWIGILDRDGRLLTSEGVWEGLPLEELSILPAGMGRTQFSLPGGRYTLQYIRSEESGWLFAALISNRVYSGQSSQVLWIVGVCILLFVGCALLLTGMIARNSRKPLAQLVQMLPIEEQGGRPGLWPLQRAVEKLALDNEELNGQLGAQQVQLRDAAISQLVKGNFEDENEIRLLLSHTGVELAGPAYRGLYMQVMNQSVPNEANMNYQNYRHTVVSEVLNGFAPALQLLTIKNSSEYILLYSQAPGQTLEEVVSAAYTTLKSAYNLDTVFFAGVPCQDLRTLNQSFSFARALAMREAGDEKYLHVAERRPINKTVYDYTPSEEVSLVSSAQRGEMEKTGALLADVYERNFVQRSLSPFMRQALYSAMLHTLSRSDCPLTLPAELTNVPLHMAPKAFFQALWKQYGSISEWAQENRRRDSKLTMDKVLLFIRENFCDSAMSLTYTATHFGLTEQYLSECFKKRTEMNFSTYLEELRIRRAQTLLRTTETSVQNIAESVGYSNIRSFRRAYSRVLGHPPSDDRGDGEA